MKPSFEFKQLILAGILILTGLITPSDGLDSLIKESVRSLLAYAIATALGIAIIYQLYQVAMKVWKKLPQDETQKA